MLFHPHGVATLDMSLWTPLLVDLQYKGKSEMMMVLSVLTICNDVESNAVAGGNDGSFVSLILSFSLASAPVQVANANVLGLRNTPKLVGLGFQPYNDTASPTLDWSSDFRNIFRLTIPSAHAHMLVVVLLREGSPIPTRVEVIDMQCNEDPFFAFNR